MDDKEKRASEVEPLVDGGDGDAWVEKRRLAAAMREMIERVLTTVAPASELRVAADRLEQYAAHLAKSPQQHVTWGTPEAANAGAVQGFFDASPLIGLANPLAPPMSLWTGDKVVHGKVTFGWAYQGPPGHVHGGLIAAAFDEILGFAQSMAGQPAMTGTLTIKYRHPTPLYTELRIEGLISRVEGRKIFAEARLYAGDTVTAEAEGIFIAVKPESVRKLAEGYMRATKGA